jgi:hypothetical protein
MNAFGTLPVLSYIVRVYLSDHGEPGQGETRRAPEMIVDEETG